MRLKRIHVPARNATGQHFARRPRVWRVVPASTAAALALGCVGTVVAHEAMASGGGTAQLAGSASPVPVPVPVPHTKSARSPAKTARKSPIGKDTQQKHTPAKQPARGTGVMTAAVKPYATPQLLSAVPVGPGAVSGPVQMVLTSPGVTTALDQDGIPQVALAAYQHSASVLAVTDPSCHLPWQLVAAIGRVESDDGRFGGSMLLANGDTTIPIYGIPLDGRPGVALLRAPGGGFERAQGPMQFLPTTWATDGVDGNGDGKADINNIFDAALTAGQYLCAGGGNLTDSTQAAAAVRRYNDADDYVRVVLALAASYENGDAAVVSSAVEVGGGAPAVAPPAAPSAPPASAPAASAPAAAPATTAPAASTPAASTPAASTPAKAPAPTAPAAATPTKAPATTAPPAAPAKTPPAPLATTPPTTAPPTTTPATAPAPAAPPTTTATTTPAAVPTTTLAPPATSPTTAPTPPSSPTTAPPVTPTPSQGTCPEPTTTVPAEGSVPTEGSVPASGAEPTTTVPPTPPTNSSQPGATVGICHTVAVGWAPAMRKVVVGLLSGPKVALTRPPTPWEHGSRLPGAVIPPASVSTAADPDQS